ncbi:hypothetical protein [Nostoc sp.]
MKIARETIREKVQKFLSLIVTIAPSPNILIFSCGNFANNFTNI